MIKDFQFFVFMALGVIVVLMIGIFAELIKISNGVWNMALSADQGEPSNKENPGETYHHEQHRVPLRERLVGSPKFDAIPNNPVRQNQR